MFKCKIFFNKLTSMNHINYISENFCPWSWKSHSIDLNCLVWQLIVIDICGLIIFFNPGNMNDPFIFIDSYNFTFVWESKLVSKYSFAIKLELQYTYTCDHISLLFFWANLGQYYLASQGETPWPLPCVLPRGTNHKVIVAWRLLI